MEHNQQDTCGHGSPTRGAASLGGAAGRIARAGADCCHRDTTASGDNAPGHISAIVIDIRIKIAITSTSPTGSRPAASRDSIYHKTSWCNSQGQRKLLVGSKGT